MRFLSLLFLIILLGVVGVFAFQNSESVSVYFFDRGITVSLALLVGCVYLLGMLSGWAVVGMVRRSVARVTEYQPK